MSEQVFCTVCGAESEEVGPDAGAFSTCPLDLLEDGHGDEPDAWERANCLDDQLGEADARTWLEKRYSKT